MNKRSAKLRLEYRMGIVLILFTTLILGAYSFLRFQSEKQRHEHYLTFTMELASERLGESLATPLWNIDENQVRATILSEMRNPVFHSILVYAGEEKTPSYGFGRNREWEVVEYRKMEEADPSHILQKNRPVTQFDKNIGTVTIQMTKRFMHADLKESMMQIGVAALVLNILIYFCVLLCIRQMVIRPLRRFMKDTQSFAKEVQNASQAVSAASRELAEGASEQAASVEESLATLEEVNQKSRKNAGIAKETHKLYAENRTTFESAIKTMDALLSTMEKTDQSIETVRAIIRDIDEIAFKTNLLSLNAAIEASNAGEAGIGFAVVADAVRSLAMETAQASSNTARMIEETIVEVQKGTGATKSAHDDIHQLVLWNRENEAQINTILSASQEQAKEITAITKAVAEIDRITQANTANAEQSSAVSSQMNQLVKKLNRIIEELLFQLGTSRNNSATPKQTPPLLIKNKPRLIRN